MSTSSNSKKRSSKSSPNSREKKQVCSSKIDENRQRVQKCLMSPKSKMEAKTQSYKKKEPQTLQMLIQKMKTTDDELKYRSERSKDVNLVEKYSKLFKCTKCQKNYRPVLNKHKKLDVHPILGVLMCFDCRNYYGDGNFSMDSDGEDKYCRWCGEGGTLFSCSKCICGFCDICIRRHFGNEYLKKVEKDDDWVCFFCDPQPLWPLRFITAVAEQAARKHNEPFEKKETFCRKSLRNERDESSSDETESDLVTPTKNQTKRHGRRTNNIYTTSSDDSDEETVSNSRKKLRFSNNLEGDSPNRENESSPEGNKLQAVKNLENILKLTEYQMGLGLDWSKKKFNKLKTVNDKTPVDKLKRECQKIKWFISVISSYLVGFCNSIDTIEKSLEEEETRTLDTSISSNNHLTYDGIFQFLGFITNQVKTFSEKGITLQDLLQAELYEDGHVLGFKKKSNSNSSHTTSKKSPPKPMGEKSDDNNVTVDSGESKRNEENGEMRGNSEESSPEIGHYKTTKDKLRESHSKSDKKKSRKTLGDSNPEKDISATEKNSPDLNEFNVDWQSSVNGEDVRDILTILESA